MLYLTHFNVAACKTIVETTGSSTLTMKLENILNLAKCTANYAPTHAIRFS